jgi:hypothetical protein
VIVVTAAYITPDKNMIEDTAKRMNRSGSLTLPEMTSPIEMTNTAK